MTQGDYSERALSAYRRSGGTDQPQQPDVATHQGRRYVVLRNVRGVLAVYRIASDGGLKRLQRWPSELNDE